MTAPDAPHGPLDLDGLYRTHARKVFGLALQITGDRSLAEDVVQEAFLAAHRGCASYRGEAAPSTWLYRIAVREACRARALHARTVAATDAAREAHTAATAPPAPDRAGAEDIERLLWAIDQLTHDQRLALVLLQVRELPGEDIAAMLGVPVGTVYSRAFAARRRMQELLCEVNRPPAPDAPATPLPPAHQAHH